ncbi:hypothetical protein E7Z59_09375 [Robertkochia marina]|uniref:Nicotinate-nucleotide adenylyltransferase n=1 Tax=Robertkochia marina TaxID=1227945 RepID=A0A4S3M0A5_9FLAO|nr:hypothetical protein [Robertkochia marina]THD67850.1 hypothetical protein E7Z59_09375 [Robertkochia marina]TRZ42111.1 hypothetical protein D3A96_12340 [Robertkochia marina]
MKTLVVTVLAILSFGIITAQETPVVLEDVVVSSKNQKFLNAVQDDYTPDVAREMEALAARYELNQPHTPYYLTHLDNITETDYVVEFFSTKGYMYALYDENGDISVCSERYKDISLPKPVRDQVYNENEGWQIDKNQYKSVFKNDKLIKKEYKMHLSNGNDSRVVVVDVHNRN